MVELDIIFYILGRKEPLFLKFLLFLPLSGDPIFMAVSMLILWCKGNYQLNFSLHFVVSYDSYYKDSLKKKTRHDNL